MATTHKRAAAAKAPAKKSPARKPDAAAKPANKAAPAKPAPKAPARKPDAKASMTAKPAASGGKAAPKNSPLRLAPPPPPVSKKRLVRKNITFVDRPIPPEGMKKPHKKPNPVTFVHKQPQVQQPKPPPQTAADIAAAEESARKARSLAYEIASRMKAVHLKADAGKAKNEIKPPRRPSNRGPGNGESFPKADLEQFRKTLISMREMVAGRSGALKSVALDQIDPHALDDEDGTDAFMRLQALGQVGSHQSVIQKIDQALRAIDDGTYGVCSVCGRLIRKQRLAQMPFAVTCMECQTDMEKPFGAR